MAQGTVETKPSLSLERTLRAAPQQVWRAWTQAEALTQWFAPSDASKVEVIEIDARVGGRYRITITAPDGEVHEVSGVYREVVPNERLVFTWAWRTTPERMSQVTVTLRPEGTGTALTLTHAQFFDDAARDRHRQGWTTFLDRLDAAALG
jgi:uncharacterized protein YndB with AHSA1/START domain